MPRKYIAIVVAPLVAPLLTACATLFPPPMPKLAPGFQRENVTEGSSSCTNRNCWVNVKVGDQRFRVETKVRVVSQKELTGATAGERAAAGLIGWMVRQTGVNTIDDQLYVGTRTVTQGGALWSLVCQVAWIDQRDRGKSETTHTRVTEGMDCVQKPASDSANVHTPWRFRLGAHPSLDSMASVKDTLGIVSGGTASEQQVTLERSLPGSKRYALVEEPFGTILGIPRSAGWAVQRDGSTIAALRVPPVFWCLGPCALEFGGATEEEKVILRFIAAALRVPLQ